MLWYGRSHVHPLLPVPGNTIATCCVSRYITVKHNENYCMEASVLSFMCVCVCTPCMIIKPFGGTLPVSEDIPPFIYATAFISHAMSTGYLAL